MTNANGRTNNLIQSIEIKALASQTADIPEIGITQTSYVK